MRLYHSSYRPKLLVFFLVLLGFLSACSLQPTVKSTISIHVIADGGEREIQVTAGSTVQEALEAARITQGDSDRVDPPLYTILTEGDQIKVTRVREEFIVEQVVIPYDEKTLRNESLPEGKEYSLQAGENGLQERTTRRVFEDGKEVSSSIVKSVVIKEALSQIKMVGVQKPFAPIPIPGRLVYLSDGDAWIIEGNTGNRTPLVTTGDLDGRIFSLSPDGKWLLYTRRSKEEGVINTLWAARLSDETNTNVSTVDLKVKNIIHFADWKPNSSYTIAYSTVEPRATAPGWQANNDLNELRLTGDGEVRNLPPDIETNMGGKYGWWGMNFTWSPDGSRLAYARPDNVGLFTSGEKALSPLMDIVALQTRADWAWVPGINWGPDGKLLFTVIHAPAPGVASLEESPLFDMVALPFAGGAPVSLVTRAGMFAYPLPSPMRTLESGENAYQVAYLQANNPTSSETSRYQVNIMDHDGSNRRKIFPLEGSLGIDPQGQWGAWSPLPVKSGSGYALAIIYQNNLWIVDTTSGETWQVTGDNLLVRVDWR